MSDTTRLEDNAPPQVVPNSTTKAELLSRAKTQIEAGESSMREAAEALALAQRDFSASQREIAKAVGRSVSWVNRLLKWQRSGYKECSPFGPTTTADRVTHAKQRIKTSKPNGTGTEPTAEADDATASGERRKAENAKRYAEPKTATSTARSPLDEFKAAVDHWFPEMDDAAKLEAVNYTVAKSNVSKRQLDKLAADEASPA